jgi:hypothetical protein
MGGHCIWCCTGEEGRNFGSLCLRFIIHAGIGAKIRKSSFPCNFAILAYYEHLFSIDNDYDGLFDAMRFCGGRCFLQKGERGGSVVGAMQGNEDLNDFTRKVIGEWCNVVW